MNTGRTDSGLYWQSSGEGPAILFIHAGVADSRMWRDQMEAFDGYQCIAFDKRGYGQTPWVPGGFSDTDDTLEVLDTLSIDTAVIVGCSMGGGPAMEIAIDHPHRIAGLVLVGAFPSGWVPEGGFEELPLEEEAETAAEAGDFDRVVEIDLQMWLVGYGRSAEDVDPALKDLFRDMDRIPVPTEARREEYRRASTKKLNDHLDSITTPTLVMVGVHDEPLLIDAAEYMAGRFSDHPAVVVEKAAHLPSFEQPSAFNAALSAFLTTL